MEVDLTETGRNWLQEHYPKGIPYRIPHMADGKPTIAKTNKKAIS